MKANKIIATLVVLAMLLSTLVVFNQLDVIKEANAQPGVDGWGNATIDIVYDTTYSNNQIKINTSKWAANGTYYLYYPNYWSVSPGVATNFSWDGPYTVGSEEYPVRVIATQAGVAGSETFDNLGTGGNSIKFLRAGMWIFSDDGGVTPAGYLWVNTSTVLSISSTSTFSYGSDAELEITVTEGGNNAACVIAVLDPDNNTVYQQYSSAGTATLDQDYFDYAGKYTIRAYRDLDNYKVYYYYDDEDDNAYDPLYGSDYSGVFPIGIAEGYDYSVVGPWDPPEKNATEKTFNVGTGKPTIVLTNTSIFWGFETRIDINVTNSTGAGLDFVPNPIMLKYGSNYVDFSAAITNEGDGNYSLKLARFDEDTDWADLATALGDDNVNGTWRIVFGYDPNADDTYEWNNSASFTVRSSNPPVQLVIVDDGSGTPNDKKVNVPDYSGEPLIPGTGNAGTIDIVFDIFGRSITDEYRNAYYGDDPDEEDGVMDNLTIEGDILYPFTEADLVYSGTKGRWTATVTPTKPDGAITLTIDWPGDENGTATQTIEIVNGTYVTSAVDSFTVGMDFNLTVTVTDMENDPVKNAQVYLMWEDVPDEFNSTVGNNQAGRGLNGQYTFWIQPHEDDATTPDFAPQNITVAARWYEGFWGYTKVIMERNHNMIVTVTPTTAYAGDAVEYDIMVTLEGGGHPDTDDLSVALFNETGEYVTGVDEWYIDGEYDIQDELIPLSGGTYYIAAMNKTCDSRDNNATLVITSYVVTSSPTTLAWKIDEVNMTFQLTPAGDGTLTIYNMTGAPEASIEGDETEIAIENGVGTLEEVNASTLGNVTYSYRPDMGEDRPADGLLRVTTATATPSPATIYNGEPTLVTITITHPATGAPLEDVDVRLEAWNASLSDTILAKIPDNESTDASGKVQFSITADASGEVVIYIENATDPDNEFVIVATARKPMSIHLNPSVDEGETFTVEAKSNGVLITDVTVTFTFDGQTWPTNTGVATITSPTVATSMAYPISASAEGYVTATGAIITVLNIPKLIVAVAGEVKAGQTFTLTVADDTGSAVIGATVTFEGKTYTTGAGGSVTITAPSKAGSYPVTATFPGYDPVSGTVTIAEGGGIPGFELLTLIAAIGVAFLLLRRRRK